MILLLHGLQHCHRCWSRRGWFLPSLPKNWCQASIQYWRRQALLFRSFQHWCFSFFFRNLFTVRRTCSIWSIKLLPQKLFSPPGISSQGWWGFLLPCGGQGFFPPGVHGEGEAGPNGQGEGESQWLASQCLAKIQTLGQTSWIFFTHWHCSHFNSLFLNQKYLLLEIQKMHICLLQVKNPLSSCLPGPWQFPSPHYFLHIFSALELWQAEHCSWVNSPEHLERLIWKHFPKPPFLSFGSPKLGPAHLEMVVWMVVCGHVLSDQMNYSDQTLWSDWEPQWNVSKIFSSIGAFDSPKELTTISLHTLCPNPCCCGKPLRKPFTCWQATIFAVWPSTFRAFY